MQRHINMQLWSAIKKYVLNIIIMYFVVIIRHAKCILVSKFQPVESNRH